MPAQSGTACVRGRYDLLLSKEEDFSGAKGFDLRSDDLTQRRMVRELDLHEVLNALTETRAAIDRLFPFPLERGQF